MSAIEQVRAKVKDHLIEKGLPFSPLVKVGKDQSPGAIVKALASQIADIDSQGEKLPVEIVTKTIEGKIYIVAILKSCRDCGGEENQYCPQCGCFHWNLSGMNNAEARRFKLERITAYAKNRISSKSRSEAN